MKSGDVPVAGYVDTPAKALRRKLRSTDARGVSRISAPATNSHSAKPIGSAKRPSIAYRPRPTDAITFGET